MKYPAYIHKQEGDKKYVYVPDISDFYGTTVENVSFNEAFEIARGRANLALLKLAVDGKPMPKPFSSEVFLKKYYYSRMLDFKDPSPRRSPVFFSLTEEMNKAMDRAGISASIDIFVEALEIDERAGWTFVHIVTQGPKHPIRAVGSSECGPKDKFDTFTGTRIALFRAVRSLAAALKTK